MQVKTKMMHIILDEERYLPRNNETFEEYKQRTANRPKPVLSKEEQEQVNELLEQLNLIENQLLVQKNRATAIAELGFFVTLFQKVYYDTLILLL